MRSKILHYEIAEEIGRGGMSQVYRALDPSLDRQVALKVLLARFSGDDERLQQFEKEAQITASFTHPNVVKVYAVGRDEGDLFIVMELVENGSLDQIIAQEGKVTERQALTWALETAHGLNAAYQNGLIHRDVKPGNILLAKDRSAKLVDFGLALMFQREQDQSKEVWATPYYVPPEKLLGEAEDHRSDIYSLGATLYHLLVGRPSVEVNTGTYEELHAAKTQPVSLKPLQGLVSPATSALIQKMMAVSPNDRHATYEELIAQMEHAQGAKGLGNSSGNAGDRFLAKQRAKKEGKSPWPIAGALGAGLLIAGGLAWVLSQPANNPQAASEEGAGGLAEDSNAASTPVSDAPPTLSLGQQFLLQEDWQRASQEFKSVVENENSPLGMKQWALFHGGLTKLFAGESAPATKLFTSLANHSGTNQDLNNFFAELTENLTSKGPIKPALADDTPEGDYYPLALLCYGLKNWHLGALPEAQHCLQAFRSRDPGGSFKWIRNYRMLTEKPLADLQWLTALPPVESLITKDELQKALADSETFAEKAVTSRARQWLKQRQEGIKQALQTHQDQEASAVAASAADAQRLWSSLQSQLQRHGSALELRQGFEALRSQQSAFENGELSEMHALQSKIWEQAEAFLTQTLDSMPGNSANIVRRNGRRLRGEVVSANTDTISIKTTEGTVSVPFKDIAPWTFARAARRQMEAVRDSNDYYKRLERFICFASVAKLDRVMRKQAAILARENRPFREWWNRWQASTPKSISKP